MFDVLRQRFTECGLELHPVKTKIVYYKDDSRKGQYENTAFDFLGYTFRRGRCWSRKRNGLFSNFTPAVSNNALKSMRLKIRKLRVRMATNRSINNWLGGLILLLMGG
jgi:RNA-directed DNA polymerase